MKKIVGFLGFLIFILIVVFLANSAEAAYLYFSPQKGNFYANENFNVGVYVRADAPINAVQGAINFPTEFLEAININSNSHSIINSWVQRLSFSNAGNFGNVAFAGIIFNPGYKGPGGKIMEINFRIKKEGYATLNFTDFAILANDGLGTNVSTPNGNADFVFLPARALPKEKSGGGGDSQLEDRVKLVEQQVRVGNSQLEDKIKSVEQTVEQKIQGITKPRSGILRFWNILPRWIQVIVLIFIDLGVLILGFLIVTFGALMFVWLWNYLWGHQRTKFFNWLKYLPRRIKKFWRKALGLADSAKEEFESDIKYSIRQLEKDYREAKKESSFVKTLKDYWVSIKKIVKRFFKNNV